MKVWAPTAEKVELVAGDGEYQLTLGRAGWWSSTQVRLKPGDDYWFRIDGSRPLPDPRSSWQPEGVHGPSRVVDHAGFAWTDKHWQAKPLAAGILYELHIGTFTRQGTFEAAIERLDHLVDLGITHVELMPVAEFEGNYGWGYDGVFPFAPHHSYGGPLGLKRLVNACHAKGLGVLLDVVYNHFGPTGNYLPRFGPYFTDRHQTPWGDALNFDGPYSDEVRQYFCDNAAMWLRDYHFDGLRLDAVHAIVDTSAFTFLEQLATEVDALKASLGRHLVLIAESDSNDPRIVRPWEIGGFGLDAQWSDDIHHALHAMLTGENEGYYSDFGSLADLGTAMTRPFVYAGRHSGHRQRRHGRAPLGISASKFIAYLQNHDQLGNRAQGERLSHLVNPDRAKIGAALILLSPYVPMLFQGEEWGASAPFQYFVDFRREPELAQAVVEGRQREFSAFGWKAEDVANPTDVETFLRSKIDWSEIFREPHGEILTWHAALIKLRGQVSAFTDGRLDCVSVHFDEQREWLSIQRGPVFILCNFAQEQQVIELPQASLTRVLLTSKRTSEPYADSIRLPAESVAICMGPEMCLTEEPTVSTAIQSGHP
jgi:maltooligosyltrehalose trehalohydrolase